MRKFLLKILMFLLYLVVINIIIPVWIDPFNVFHTENIRANGIEPNFNYVKMKYILANPGKFDSFLFGSSRVGAIHTEKIAGAKCYNMIYSTGLPGWHLLNIKTMYKNGINPKKVYVGVDTISYTGNYDAQRNMAMRCPYEYLENDFIHFANLYLNAALAVNSLDTILEAWLSEREVFSPDIFYKYGWDIDYSSVSNFNWDSADRNDPSLKFTYFYGSIDKQNMNQALEIMKEIADICREHGTELIIFTNPMHVWAYLDSVRGKDYFRFLEGLAEISDFWNFSSINGITTNNANYREPSHYWAQVGDIMIDIMCNGKSYPELNAQGFGVRVTKENAKDFISMLRRQAENFTE